MATSIFIARLLGPLLLLPGIGILFNQRAFRRIADEVVRSVTLVYLFGLLDLAGGVAIVLTHNVWLASWRVIITLLGWVLTVRGAVRIVAPEIITSYAGKLLAVPNILTAAGAVIAVLGLLLCYFGYVA